MKQIPFFLTVDTEGDNSWDKPKIIKTENVERLQRFQSLCDDYNVKPIYLTNFEAVENKAYQEFVKQNFSNLEIGLHLHAWNSPPKFQLTHDDMFHQPYLHEYPKNEIISKIDFLVKKLQDTFSTEIISHRGGRYSISKDIFESLASNGIKIDCSVVPGFDWRTSMGNPNGKGGPDFRKYNSSIFEIHPGITEIPVSTIVPKNVFFNTKDTFLPKRIYNKVLGKQKLTLRSKLDNFEELKKVTDFHIEKSNHLEYIIHSSELVCGTSNLIKSNQQEDLFYENLEKFFVYLKLKNIKSQTFKNYLNKNN